VKCLADDVYRIDLDKESIFPSKGDYKKVIKTMEKLIYTLLFKNEKFLNEIKHTEKYKNTM